MPLNRNPNIADPDAFYHTLIDAHADLTDAESQAFNTRLVLLLANHIGEISVLQEAIETARKSLDRRA